MTPDMRIKLRGMIMNHEGFRGAPYKDTTGNLTIGYGHNLDARPISEFIGGAMLDEDLQWFISQLEHKLPWFADLDDPRKCVLVDMAYNLGLQGLLEFNIMLSKVERGDYRGAADDMMQTKWYQQVGERAIQDAHIMRTGEI